MLGYPAWPDLLVPLMEPPNSLLAFTPPTPLATPSSCVPCEPTDATGGAVTLTLNLTLTLTLNPNANPKP